VDRPAAEAGMRRAYAAAGLPPPTLIAWANGPFEAATEWAKAGETAGDNVRALLIDVVRRKAEAAVDRNLGLGVRTALAAETRLSRSPPFCASIDEAVFRDCERVRPKLGSRLANIFKFSAARKLSFAASSFSFFSAPSLGAMQYLHDVCGMQRQTAALLGLWEVAQNASWVVPHERVCWLADRPEILRHDANGRLHAADGPALKYPDGWSAYAWKGILVSPWMIERPELVNVRTIAAAHDPQIRRCMIEIMTPARFIAEGGAYRVAQDDTGVLWRQRWRWEAWAAVEVINGSPEPDGTFKHYFLQVPPTMRTAREAVAWTYGLTEQRYRPVVRT
jgi:hypothetical protein